MTVKGEADRRRFKIRWHGFGPEDDTWEPHCNISPGGVKSFLQENGHYDYNWPEEARCKFCDKPCKNSRGAKIHAASCPHRPDPQNFKGTCADKKVQDNKVEEAQKKLPQVECGEAKLGNAAWFKYLGSVFSVDGSQRRDIKRRIAMAMSRCGALRQIFDSKVLDLQLKLSIYKTAVTSVMSYGSEA